MVYEKDVYKLNLISILYYSIYINREKEQFALKIKMKEENNNFQLQESLITAVF